MENTRVQLGAWARCESGRAHCSGSNFLPSAKRDISVLMGRSAVEMMTYTEPGI